MKNKNHFAFTASVRASITKALLGWQDCAPGAQASFTGIQLATMNLLMADVGFAIGTETTAGT